MDEIDDFIATLQHIPANKRKRIRLLATELAQGVYEGFWNAYLTHNPRFGPDSQELAHFFANRWVDADFEHSIDLMQHNGFVVYERGYSLSELAFQLVDETDPYNIFVSYKRSESSMLALLVNNTLELNGFSPFFDMMLNPTEDWHARLEKQVKDSDYFIALLSTDTHKSKYTVREIHWALTLEIPIIQLWNYGYSINVSEWQSTEYPEVAGKLQQQQAIPVKTNDAEGYHLALEKLLNAVGVTP